MYKQTFDPSEPKYRFIAVFAGVTVILLVVLVLAIQSWYDRAHEQQVYMVVLAPESEDLKNLRAREDSELNSYRYIDRAKGTVRLPVDRAMELLADEAAEGRLPYPTQPAAIKPVVQNASPSAQ